MPNLFTRSGLVAGLALSIACGARSTAPTAPTSTAAPAGALSIMGQTRVPASAIVAWVNGRTPRPSGVYSAPVSLFLMY
jgi:hypothetical protein